MPANLYRIFLENDQQVQTDTRKIKPGSIFFALKGEHFDGNQFAQKALEMGAVAAVVDDQSLAENDRFFFVPDVLKSLQQLARHHRLQCNAKVIAITGSNGKTTSKELLHSVLKKKYNTIATIGNLNNHIGVPLSLLRIREDTEFAIIEMGANHIGEIESYCEWALPDIGIITNVGKAHLEGFGSLEGVKKAKGELYNFIIKNKGLLFQWGDTDYLSTMSQDYGNVIHYGTLPHNYIVATIEDTALLQFSITKPEALVDTLATQLVGAYNLPNALMAISVGHYFGIKKEDIKAAIEGYIPNNSRSQLLEKETNKIILDAYNANPSSMKEAIDNFIKMEARNKMFLLGCMKELGDDSRSEHAKLINQLEQAGMTNVHLVGTEFENIKTSYSIYKTSEELKKYLQHQKIEDTLILVKGSRGAKMEIVLDAL